MVKKKTWIRPKVIVLVRNTPEGILRNCKSGIGGPASGPGAIRTFCVTDVVRGGSVWPCTYCDTVSRS